MMKKKIIAASIADLRGIKPSMKTPQEAEVLARMALRNFVTACGCHTEDEVADALMKLVSMCGLAMCGTVGQDEAVARLQGTRDYIAGAIEGANFGPGAVQ